MNVTEKRYMTDLVKQFIWANGTPYSGYYKEVFFKKPVDIELFVPSGTGKPVASWVRMVVTGMYCESDTGACGHRCDEPFVECSSMDRCSDGAFPISDVDAKYHDAILNALVDSAGKH